MLVLMYSLSYLNAVVSPLITTDLFSTGNRKVWRKVFMEWRVAGSKFPTRAVAEAKLQNPRMLPPSVKVTLTSVAGE